MRARCATSSAGVISGSSCSAICCPKMVRASSRCARWRMRSSWARSPPAACITPFPSIALAQRCEFRLDKLRNEFPDFPLPPGETAFSYLYSLVHEGVRRRYRPVTPEVSKQIAHELGVIERMDLAGYFLIVWDIVRFAMERNILIQGRGSAANSAVCYALNITSVDPVG